MDILVVVGTRPEAIKMAPVISVLRNDSFFDVKVVNSAQHAEMLDSVIRSFSIDVDFKLDLIRTPGDLHNLTANIVTAMRDVYRLWRPDMVLVHGDTTTTFAAALSAFYERIPIGHVEAGLRTGDKRAPWPEETNRRMVTCLADTHFAPTAQARSHLLDDSVAAKDIHITGNTAVDSVSWIMDEIASNPELETRLIAKFSPLDPARRIILTTFHRRENIGDNVTTICRALLALAERTDSQVVVTLHPNPDVREPARRMLAGAPNIILLAPLDYVSFVYLMSKSTIILTDSGGIQEEAPFLGKPVLLMREATERPEAVEAGAVHMVGAGRDQVVSEVSRLLDDPAALAAMSNKGSPFGDGKAGERIRDILKYGAPRERRLDAPSGTGAPFEARPRRISVDSVTELALLGPAAASLELEASAARD